jgi:YHS domain-containing protein
MKHSITTILLVSLTSIPTFGVENPVKPYPQDKCIVSDEKLGVEGKPVVFAHEGQEIKLCCQDCRKELDANPSKFLAKLPKAEAPKAEPKKAGMDHKMMCACCAGDATAADGKAAGRDHSSAANQDDKEKSRDHSTEAQEAKPHDHDHAASRPAEEKKADAPAKPYPLKSCIVSDNDLDSMGEQASFVYQGQTIKVCCKPCIAKFEKNPAKYLKKLEGK